MPGSIGKWVCDPHRIAEDTCLIYSIGSNGTYGFEKEVRSIISKDCEVHIFDPLNFKEEAIKVGARFHNWGIGNETESKTFKETITTLEHTNKVIDVMKIDCEGCEAEQYSKWLSDWKETGVVVRHLLLEVHQAPHHIEKLFETLQNEGYVIFHKQPNFSNKAKSVEMAFILLSHDFRKLDN